MPLAQPAVRTVPLHLHVAGDKCPVCDQQIPNERLDQVNKRIVARDLQTRAEADARVKEEVQIARAQGEAALEALKSQVATREKAAREEAEKKTAVAFENRLRESAEAARAATERNAGLEAELKESRDTLTTTIASMTAEFAKKSEACRQEGRAAATAELNGKVSEALSGKLQAEQRLATMEAAQEEVVQGRLAEMREAMEKDKQAALNAEQAKNFQATQKLQNTVDDLKRQLENKTAAELGEGAEVNLYEVLKAEFPNDIITRVDKGKPGADIIHKVMHNNIYCETIIYDSKNHKRWLNEHVTKLRDDQRAEKAAHAILSTQAFPKGRSQLHIDNGVILANPARAAVVAMILREQIVQLHCLKVSNKERTRKTDELYALMTSDRFKHFLTTTIRSAKQLEAIQEEERKTHDKVWRKQAELFRSFIRACAEFDEDIGRIIGTAPQAS
jgi:hypothetical protein